MPDIDRRKVTMKSVSLAPDGSLQIHEATDYVGVEHLDAYVEDARERWQSVTVGDKTEHGPGGKGGKYALHADVLRRLPEHVRAAHLRTLDAPDEKTEKD